MRPWIKAFLVIVLVSALVANVYAGDCTVITYHQPGLVEAVGNTAVNLVAGSGLMVGGIVQGTAGLITGYDRTVVIPHNRVTTAVYPYCTVPVQYSARPVPYRYTTSIVSSTPYYRNPTITNGYYLY